MDEIRELDVVALMADLPEENLLRGQVGTVVMDLPPDAAEVEFVDQQGKTYALVSILKSQLLRLRHEPIKAA
jgi:hypothetical protein